MAERSTPRLSAFAAMLGSGTLLLMALAGCLGDGPADGSAPRSGASPGLDSRQLNERVIVQHKTQYFAGGAFSGAEGPWPQVLLEPNERVAQATVSLTGEVQDPVTGEDRRVRMEVWCALPNGSCPLDVPVAVAEGALPLVVELPGPQGWGDGVEVRHWIMGPWDYPVVDQIVNHVADLNGSFAIEIDPIVDPPDPEFVDFPVNEVGTLPPCNFVLDPDCHMFRGPRRVEVPQGSIRRVDMTVTTESSMPAPVDVSVSLECRIQVPDSFDNQCRIEEPYVRFSGPSPLTIGHETPDWPVGAILEMFFDEKIGPETPFGRPGVYRGNEFNAAGILLVEVDPGWREHRS